MLTLCRKLALAGVIASAGILSFCPPSSAAALEKKHVVIAVGGVTGQLDKLPYAVAVNLGFFKQEGLDVESIDFQSGAKGLEAMVGGSADLTQGAYEHTIEMQHKGIDLTSFVFFARYPGNVLVIPKSRAGQIKTAADLNGKRIGISSPGSATHIFLALILKRAGLPLSCCTYIGVGNGPQSVAAVRGGELDALVNLDPNISVLQDAGDATVMYDSRTAAGTEQVYGGSDIVGSLYGRSDFITKYPNTTQALTNAVIHAMRWLGTHTPDQIVDAMPKAYYQGNRELYKRAVERNLPSFIWNGLATPAAVKTVLNTISVFQPELKSAKIDVDKTWTNKFVIEANKKYPFKEPSTN